MTKSAEKAHQCVVCADELELLRHSDEAADGRMRKSGRDGQLDQGVVLVREVLLISYVMITCDRLCPDLVKL